MWPLRSSRQRYGYDGEASARRIGRRENRPMRVVRRATGRAASVSSDGKTVMDEDGDSLEMDRGGAKRRCDTMQCVVLRVGLLGSSQATRAIRTAALGALCSASTGGLLTGWSSPALQEARGLGSVHLGACFPLRCVQRLSQPIIATRRCPWQDSRDTSGLSDPVLSY